MMVVLEAFLIGGPLIFLSGDNPTAMFIIISVLISWVSFCSFASHLCSEACYSAPRFDGNQCMFLEQSLGAI
jgi:hypothetical protein